MSLHPASLHSGVPCSPGSQTLSALPEVSEGCTLNGTVPAPRRYRSFDFLVRFYQVEGVIASIPRINKLRKLL